MKRHLLALAALAGMCAQASAQSSVTIFGIIDMSVSKLNNGSTALGNLAGGPPFAAGIRNGWAMKPSVSNRLGFRGSEDLGGGLKANFTLEHRFKADDGTLEAAAFWQGQSWVSLSGAFGEVRLGRQYVPAFYIGTASDPWGYDYNVGGGSPYTRGASAGATEITRAPNAVSYLTPNLSGFTAEVQVAAGEGGAPDISNRRNVGANVRYSGGPLAAGLGYNDTDTVATQRYWNSFVAYDFGFVRPQVAYSRSTLGTVDTTSYLVGATAPLAGGRLKAVAARKNPDGANNNTTKFGLGYEYFLSKRTSVHADVGTAKTQGNFTRTTGVEAGVKHVF